MSNNTISFPKKFKKYLPVGFEENAERMETSDIKVRLIELQKEISQAETDLSNDVKVQEAKEAVKDLVDPYKDIIKGSTAMTKYYLYVLDGRGQ